MRIAGVLGSPTRTRTWDLRFRKPVLYPTELLSRFTIIVYFNGMQTYNILGFNTNNFLKFTPYFIR